MYMYHVNEKRNHVCYNQADTGSDFSPNSLSVWC